MAGDSLVPDGEGVVKLAAGDPRPVPSWRPRARRARTVASAVTLTEILRGTARDTRPHLVLSRVGVVPVTPELGRRAGELLGAAGRSGHRCAIDAIVAATALDSARPVVVLTSDPDDLTRLVDEPDRPKEARVVVVHI